MDPVGNDWFGFPNFSKYIGTWNIKSLMTRLLINTPDALLAINGVIRPINGRKKWVSAPNPPHLRVRGNQASREWKISCFRPLEKNVVESLEV